MDNEEYEPASDLVDLTGLDLDQLAELSDTVLATSLRRILAEEDDISDHYAGFKSSI